MKRPNPKNYKPTDYLRGIYENDLEKYIDYLEQSQAQLQQHGVSGKRPDCPYCMEPISEDAIEKWQIWLDNAKAACASSAVDKTVSDGCDCTEPDSMDRNGCCRRCGGEIKRA